MSVGNDLRRMSTRSGLESGRFRPEDPDFNPQDVGPNALLDASNLDMIRARSRHLIDNNPLIDGAVDAQIGKVIGKGIVVRAATPWPEINQQINAALDMAAEAVDPSRQHTLAESQRLFYREVLGAGDCGVHLITGEAFGGYPAMPAIELIAADRIDNQLNGKTDAGNRVRQGVEFDSSGRVVAYHVMTEQRNDAGTWQLGVVEIGGSGVKRIPAEDMHLGLRERRVNQIRGLPFTTSIILAARQEDGLVKDATMAARIQTVMPLYVTKSSGAKMGVPNPGKEDKGLYTDHAGNPITSLYGPMIGYLSGDSEIKSVQSSQPGPQYETLEVVMHRRMSRGLDLTYAELSGDYSRTSFSSSRAERNDMLGRRHLQQEFVWLHHTCRWAKRVVAWSDAKGMLTLNAEQRAEVRQDPRQLTKFAVHYPGEPYVNPMQEASAHGEDLENGVRSRIAIIRSRGDDVDQVIAEEVEYELKLQAARQAAGLQTPGSNPEERQANRQRRLDQTRPGQQDHQTQSLKLSEA